MNAEAVPADVDEDLRSDSPAIANLLVHDGIVQPDALAATVLDLTARGYLHLELVADTHCYRLGRANDRDALAPYERRVLELFRAGRPDALVPFDQLTVGVEDETDEWWDAFAKEVTAAARSLTYLSRWLIFTTIVGVAVLVIVTLCAMTYATFNPEDGNAQIVAVVSFVGLGVLTFTLDGVDGWVRLSRRGRWRRREWERVARELGANDSFRDVRLGGVVVWDQVFAYAAALGLAPQAVADVPIRADGPKSAWVRRDATWTRVQIRYPQRVPPGRGRPPWLVSLVGLATVAVSILVAVAVWPSGSWRGILPVIVSAAMVAGVVGLWALVVGLLDLVGGAASIEGVVVARRISDPRVGPWKDLVPKARWLAVDNGRGREIRALRVTYERFESTAVGDEVQMLVTPHLGWVEQLVVDDPFQA